MSGIATHSESTPLLPQFSCSPLDLVPVYTVVLETYDLVSSAIDTSLKYDQLRSPQVHSFLIKPIVQDIRFNANAATLYALMANMIQFQRQSQTDIAMTRVMATRALVCEILATKLLKEYDEDQLMNALTFDFYPFTGENSSREDEDSEHHSPNSDPRSERHLHYNSSTDGATTRAHRFVPRWQRASTLELAIKAEAKRFLAHPMVTKVLDDIWRGKIMFQSTVQKLHRAPVEDVRQYLAYSRRGPPVRYNYEETSILKLSRLRVPRYRSILTLASFCMTLLLYIAVLRQEKSAHISKADIIFGIWTLGFILDEVVGFTDVGPTLYIQSLWNIFDLIILVLLLIYSILRILALSWLEYEPDNAQRILDTSYNILATVAIFLFPRLFSVLDHYESFSGMVIAVRKMSIDLFIAWVVIAVLSSGFWVAFTTSFAPKHKSAGSVAFDLTKILFGFTPAVWDTWQSYSFIGRINLMLYLFITHFVIMTILIAVLSNSFAAVIENGHEEHQYLFAINTISMIKSESSGLFSYIPPLNVIEWALRPLYYVVPLRRFLVINRTAVKITHFPILYTIYLYETLHVKIQSARSKQMFRSGSALNISGINTPIRRINRHIGRPAKSRVSKYDLLDEVFRRPYKGTVRMRKPKSQDKGLTDLYEADMEENDPENDFDDEDDVSFNLTAELHSPKDRDPPFNAKPSSSTSKLADLFHQPETRQLERPMSSQRKLRPRLFSTTSSLVQNYTRNLSISPTRSTSSVLGRNATIKRLRNGTIQIRNRRDRQMSHDFDFEDNDNNDETNLAQRLENRMDELQESFKNMQAMLEEIVSVTSHYR